MADVEPKSRVLVLVTERVAFNYKIDALGGCRRDGFEAT
jgi:hypothetical protein